jgi:TM2 domain-containing membrane protein YozV/RNA polymerase subunit RPABC4/transcription elongation factor Spt4
MSENQEFTSALSPMKAADQKHCFSCGNIVHLSASQCPKCGAQQPNVPSVVVGGVIGNEINSIPNKGLGPNQVFCRGCGTPIHESAAACPKCGAQQRTTSENSSGTSGKRTTAAILAIFLGGLGVHKFYLGSILLGFIYLIFCWTFIPGIVGFCEGIYYLTMSDSEFDKKFN